jgi:hypothetical protein
VDIKPSSAAVKRMIHPLEERRRTINGWPSAELGFSPALVVAVTGDARRMKKLHKNGHEQSNGGPSAPEVISESKTTFCIEVVNLESFPKLTDYFYCLRRWFHSC